MPIDEDVDILSLTDVVVKIGGVEYAATLQEDGVLVNCPATLEKGSYDIVLTAQYVGNEIRAAYFEALTIVSYNYQSDAHNFVQGSPIVMQPAFVIYNLSDAELEALKIELREKIADAEAAEQAAEQAKEEWERKAAELDNVAQQGANPLATLSATQAAVEALAPVAQAAQAYNTGKPELATNITAKGVPASADETLPELAEKVSAIAQNSYTIDGGELYAKQLFGSLTTPNYWNLYEVLEMLLSDGRLVNYGGILLAEYYKGYDSLALSGAGAGGAYVVSDKDSQGNFIMYTSDTTHVWDTAFDGKGNRWVAYCFADEYHDFQITDTNTSPRSIFIGRKVGTITCLANTRTSQVVVPDESKLKKYISGTYTGNWGKNVIFRGIEEIGDSPLLYNPSNTECIYIECDKISGRAIYLSNNSAGENLSTIILKAKESALNTDIYGGNANNVGVKTIYITTTGTIIPFGYGGGSPNLKQICLCNVEQLTMNYSPYPTLGEHTLYILYETNDKTKSIVIGGDSTRATKVIDVVLKDGWCKPLDIHLCTTPSEALIYSHILQRLKQDEPDCGDGVTITLGATNLAKLTSAESIALLDSLTNTYGYTFA